ncbi:type 4a pilus biogenesis protein PilO [bacterium]|nr:type 4a pilus biogenesis protein PilO [bacterium]
MEETNKNLEDNIGVLEQISEDVEIAGNNLKYLEEYMPLEYRPEGYLLDFSYAAARSGFSVRRYNPQSRTQGNQAQVDGLDIDIRLSGSGDVASLIRNIEEMKRITSIQGVEYTFENYDGVGSLRVRVRIFSSGGVVH